MTQLHFFATEKLGKQWKRKSTAEYMLESTPEDHEPKVKLHLIWVLDMVTTIKVMGMNDGKQAAGNSPLLLVG